MPLDASLLEQAKAAEGRVIDAEHAAEVARADFHRTVRRLQLAGASLREIADALGLSHQRVHQIVESAGGSRRWRSRRPSPEQLACCSFCGRDQKHTKALITGPGGVGICDRCIPQADATIAAETPPAGKKVTLRFERIYPVPGEAKAERCSFCGKRRHQVTGMAAAGQAQARICDECLALCREIRDEIKT
jgi:ClpX C4-type zinc finger protein